MQDNLILAVINLFDNLEALFVDLASKLAPWLAPLLSAVVVTKAMTQEPFNWNMYLAVLTGAAIELSGISSLSTVLLLWSHWSEQPTDHKPSMAPLVIAVLCALAYLFTALSLAVVLKMVQGLEVLAYGLFVLLALTSAVNLAIRQDYQKRVNHLTPKKPSKRRKPANGPVHKPVSDQSYQDRQANLDRANESRELPTQADYDQAAALKSAGLTWKQVANELDVSQSTAKRWAAQSKPVYSLNGRGGQ